MEDSGPLFETHVHPTENINFLLLAIKKVEIFFVSLRLQ